MAISDEVLARTVHGAILAFCQATGDDSIKPWDEAEDWQRRDSLRVVQFFRENPAASAATEHDRWLEQKLADGWRYGELKDSAAKTNPAMRPFDELPDEQQAKDKIIKAIVNALS